MQQAGRVRWEHRLARLAATAIVVMGPVSVGAQADGNGANLIERMQRSTVQVLCADSWGSGFSVGNVRTIVTNAHVVEECENLRVRGPDGAIAPARVVVVDRYKDVAVLEVSGSPNVVPTTLRSDAGVNVGEEVFALGFPGIAQHQDGDIQVQSSLARVTRGPISRAAYPQNNGERFMLDHSAGIYHGNSGGPLFDACGRVIGVNTEIGMDSREQFYGTVGFAVGTRTIAELLQKAGVSVSVTNDGCRVGFGTIVGAAVVSAKAASPDAQAAVGRLEASYRKLKTEYDTKWDSLQTIVAQGDSAETARAQKAEESLAGLLNGVQSQVNSSIAGVNTRIDGVEERIAKFEKQFSTWLLTVSIVLAVVVMVVGGVVWRQRVQGAQLAETGRELVSNSEKLDDLERNMSQIREQLREHEQELQRRARRVIDQLSQQDAKGGRDARAAVEVLLETPGYTESSMSDTLRTRVARTVRGGNDAPETRRDRTQNHRTRPDRTHHDGLLVELTIHDGRSSHSRAVTLAAGSAAYIGRDERALRAVAEAFALTPVIVPLAADDRVSRCHMSISNEGECVRVTDMSLNGTFASMPLSDVQRSNRPVDGGRRNRAELLETGDSVGLRNAASFALARPDSGFTIDVRLRNADGSAFANN